ncbi:MAG TPA: imidazoleglycerol-phosphate dehydratase HisB [Firmicutes bacterium]|nr:imidazoleglycerol-phosphate dehydratase HisB [Bacillota bacterium]
MQRTAEIKRKTTETDIELSLCLDGSGIAEIQTGSGFLNHMLTSFARHGRFDLTVRCTGDTWVDYHHTVEDVGICLGEAIAAALGDMRGVTRFGSAVIPMDEALVLAAVDLSGRACLGYALEIPAQKVGDFDTELAEEFFLGLVRTARMTLHLRSLAGKNSHHIIEGAFKSFARALRQAVSIDPAAAGEIPSTKGVL